MTIVVVFEPQREIEPELGLAGQVHMVCGPFPDDAQADAWIARFQEAGTNHFEFLITELDAAPEPFPTGGQL